LTVPHPRLHLRRFVLAPMAELDPEWPHPVLHRAMQELLAGLTDSSHVRRLDPSPGSQYGSRTACRPSSATRPIS
jgi:2-amino-4-hydroxy-6-hydroxymethyldihydropteridine diphosphokinase